MNLRRHDDDDVQIFIIIVNGDENIDINHNSFEDIERLSYNEGEYGIVKIFSRLEEYSYKDNRSRFFNCCIRRI